MIFVPILIVHAQRIRVARDHASAPRTRTLDAAHLAFDQMLLIWHLIRLHSDLHFSCTAEFVVAGVQVWFALPWNQSRALLQLYFSSKVVWVEASILTNMRKG